MFLGIDTSCYTTSLAVIDIQGRLLADERRMLAVPQGRRGLRQSDGLFQHVQSLPQLAQAVRDKLETKAFLGIAASTRPRPVEGSYMPVFTAGAAFGKTLAALMGVPFLELSHQEGHLLAGMWSAAVDWREFYLLHVSGGTTELLRVSTKACGDSEICELGGSADLHAGQFIDRVGVALGLPFPAGPHLEALAKTLQGKAADIPVAVSGLNLSLSGPESHVQRVIAAKKAAPAAVARGVEHCIAQSLLCIVQAALREYGEKPVLFVGGVMANSYIRCFLTERLPDTCAFAGPAYAGDNAVGAALYAKKKADPP